MNAASFAKLHRRPVGCADGRLNPRAEPGDRRGDRRGAAVGRARRREGRRRRVEGVADVATHAARRSHPAAVPAQGAARRAVQRPGAHHHRRSAARRWPRPKASCARHRERRGRERHPVADAWAATSRTSPSGIDELMIRQPVGVVGVITPFNFPGMIPLWFLPYAVACGNTVILKPSEKTPITMAPRSPSCSTRPGCPTGVVNLVHGGKDAVDAILDHPEVRAISFVGSTPVARYIYAARRRQRQARAVPGRREEPDRRPARRRHGDDDADRGRLGVRLRRPALPGLVGRHHRRRGRADRSRRSIAMRRRRARSATASTPASRWGR